MHIKVIYLQNYILKNIFIFKFKILFIYENKLFFFFYTLLFEILKIIF